VCTFCAGIDGETELRLLGLGGDCCIGYETVDGWTLKAVEESQAIATSRAQPWINLRRVLRGAREYSANVGAVTGMNITVVRLEAELFTSVFIAH